MKPWKIVLGAGAACAACCAAPIVSGMSALGIGSGLFAGGAAALSAFTGSWMPLAVSGVLLAAVGGALAWHRRREAARN